MNFYHPNTCVGMTSWILKHPSNLVVSLLNCNSYSPLNPTRLPCLLKMLMRSELIVLSCLVILRTVGPYLSTVKVATVCKLFATCTIPAECSAQVVCNCHTAQLGRVYSPRSCNSNTPTQRSDYCIPPLTQGPLSCRRSFFSICTLIVLHSYSLIKPLVNAPRKTL